MHQIHGLKCMMQVVNAPPVTPSPTKAGTNQGAAKLQMAQGRLPLHPHAHGGLVLMPGKPSGPAKHANASSIALNLNKTGQQAQQQDHTDEDLDRLLNIKVKSVSSMECVVEVNRHRLGCQAISSLLALGQQPADATLAVSANRYMLHLPTLASKRVLPIDQSRTTYKAPIHSHSLGHSCCQSE
jgi:hypothetical protein